MSEPILVYHAGNQVNRFRFLLAFSLACCVASLVGCYWIAFAVEDGDLTGQERWLLALLVLALGVAFFGGMFVYARRYVVWLWVDERLREVTIETLALFGERERRFDIGDFAGANRAAGEMMTHYHRIRTPYVRLRVRNRRLPYVIDLQGHIPEEALFERLLAKLSVVRPR